MSKTSSIIKLLSICIVFTGVLFGGCKVETTTTTVVYTAPGLEYQLIDHFGNVFWCDPDVYPIARPGQEQANAMEQFPAIQANQLEFTAILNRLGYSGIVSFTDEQKLLIYQEHKKLTYMVEISPSGNNYNFTLRVGEGQGQRIRGTITPAGAIAVTTTEPSINTCPICLTKGTLIDTPAGRVPVEYLQPGMAVMSVDSSGNPIVETLLKTRFVVAPDSFQVVKLTLSDGRVVTTSLGHPAANGRALGDYKAGEVLDEAVIVAAERSEYAGFTFDILPAGTGLYRAGGILVKSSMTALP
jgi:hypothetical protein